MKFLVNNIRSFATEEDGVALTEYLVLLGLLVGGVVGTITLAGTSLDSAWANWQGFWDTMPAPGSEAGGEGGGEGGGES